MIKIYEGGVGQGKTYMLSQRLRWLLERNKIWHEKKELPIRKVYSNMAINTELRNEYKHYFNQWTDLEELVEIREADVIFDDMATYLDANEWSNIPMKVKHWLRLHEHYGVDIYGNAQDFNTININVRRLTTELERVYKIIGSHRPSLTKPTVKKIWGMFILRRVDDREFETEKEDRKGVGWPKIEFLKKKICETYDTTQELNSMQWPPLQHIERKCLDCMQIKTIHR